jgi:hypothetical protein
LALTLVCRLSPYFFGASDTFASYKLELVRCFTQGAGVSGFSPRAMLPSRRSTSCLVQVRSSSGFQWQGYYRKKKLISRYFQASWPFVLVAFHCCCPLAVLQGGLTTALEPLEAGIQHFLGWVPLLRLTHLLILRTIVPKQSSALNMRRIPEKADQNHFRTLRACSGTCQPRTEVSIRPFLPGRRSLLGFQVSFSKIT